MPLIGGGNLTEEADWAGEAVVFVPEQLSQVQ